MKRREIAEAKKAVLADYPDATFEEIEVGWELRVTHSRSSRQVTVPGTWVFRDSEAVASHIRISRMQRGLCYDCGKQPPIRVSGRCRDCETHYRLEVQARFTDRINRSHKAELDARQKGSS